MSLEETLEAKKIIEKFIKQTSIKFFNYCSAAIDTKKSILRTGDEVDLKITIEVIE